MSVSHKQLLLAGIDSLSLTLPDGAVDKLAEYISLLDQWNKSFNLTAVRNPQAMVSLHLLDSLVVLPYLGEGNVLDVGSGAGLPGIPLALAKPHQLFTLLDSNGKKTRFLTQAKIVLGLDNVEVVHKRVQDYRVGGGFDIVISRAYSDTDRFIDTTRHLHHDATRILVMQGKLDESLSSPGYRIAAAHTLTVPGLDADRHLLEIIHA